MPDDVRAHSRSDTWRDHLELLALALACLVVIIAGGRHRSPIVFGFGFLGLVWCAVRAVTARRDLRSETTALAVVLVTALGLGIVHQTAARPSSVDDGPTRVLSGEDVWGALTVADGLTLVSTWSGYVLLDEAGDEIVRVPDESYLQAFALGGSLAFVLSDVPALREADLQGRDTSDIAVDHEITAIDDQGQVAWTRQFPSVGGYHSDPVVASYDDGTVVLQRCADEEECTLVAVAPDGTERWSTPRPAGVELGDPASAGFPGIDLLPGTVAGVRSWASDDPDVQDLFIVDQDGSPREVPMGHEGRGLDASADLIAVWDLASGSGCLVSTFDSAGDREAGPFDIPCSGREHVGVTSTSAFFADDDTAHLVDDQTGSLRRLDRSSDLKIAGGEFLNVVDGRLVVRADEAADPRLEFVDVERFYVRSGTLATLHRRGAGWNPFDQDLTEVTIRELSTGRTCATWSTASEDVEVHPLADCRALVHLRSEERSLLLGGPSDAE